ncbi:LysR substrate-binding domain-containing protein [Paracoccus aminophilus]|uniref:Transcriptional regulator, LysR family n=1 Tax=Paracoccus aminophilus JCM 7686 TaxID=1367847 RepID=S5XUB5_PARAH|nr:LysR substrate-binding domain-containing protein [Paracoccus aminophilus]AGT08797.1 transcriptional regulator, LysR family [Paracoccus aminophilus JCM 7686]
MRRQITSLPALECFRAAAELESFSKAADQLNLTHGAISRAVRLLEEDLGTALFVRRNRAVFLTDDGRQLAQAVAYGFDHIEGAIQSIRAARIQAPVTVSCEPTLMMRWLIPRMAGFHARHPECDIRLVAGGGPVALGDGIDLAIRRDDFDLPASYPAEFLFAEWIGPVCRPDLQTRFFDQGQLRSDAPLLHSRTRSSAWRDWSGLSREGLAAHPEQQFEHFYFSLQAAIAGLGVAIGPWHLVRDDLRNGLLAAPLSFRQDGSSYVLLAAGKAPGKAAQGVFRNWLMALAQEDSMP